jgi:hypothetical protein
MNKIAVDKRSPAEAFELKELIGNGAFADVYRVSVRLLRSFSNRYSASLELCRALCDVCLFVRSSLFPINRDSTQPFSMLSIASI